MPFSNIIWLVFSFTTFHMFSFILNIWTLRSIFWPIELFSQCSPFAVVDIFWFVYSLPRRLLWTKRIEHVKCFVGHFSLDDFFWPCWAGGYFSSPLSFLTFSQLFILSQTFEVFRWKFEFGEVFSGSVEWGPFELLSGRFQSPLWHHNNSLCLLRHISKLSPYSVFSIVKCSKPHTTWRYPYNQTQSTYK